MARSTKESWLQGPGDVQEASVEDVPVKGESVLVRGLPAAYSNRAQSEALELIAEIDRLSGVNKEEIEAAQARFPNGDGSADREEASVSADGGK
jgi:hypothetical protein